MTKAELANEIAERTGIEKVACIAVIESFVKIISRSLVSGESVFIRRFGTFAVVTRKEKKAQNITAGTTVVVPAHNALKFKAAKELKTKIKNQKP